MYEETDNVLWLYEETRDNVFVRKSGQLDILHSYMISYIWHFLGLLTQL